MAHEDEGQPIDIGPVVDPVDQRIVPFMGQEALAARASRARHLCHGEITLRDDRHSLRAPV